MNMKEHIRELLQKYENVDPYDTFRYREKQLYLDDFDAAIA